MAPLETVLATVEAEPGPETEEARHEEIRRKNRELYDEADDPVWRLTVYGPVHGGRAFSNMGGSRLLDLVAAAANLGPGRSALELCSGLGDTCLYLAERFGCRVTGVEMNTGQVAGAEARRAAAAPEVAARVEHRLADVLEWQPEQTWDAVFALDSLALVEDLPAVLAKAGDCLAPGGKLCFGEIAAGPGLSDELRRFAWETDGMVNLPTASAYRSLVEAAGFERVVLADVTAFALDCFRKNPLGDGGGTADPRRNGGARDLRALPRPLDHLPRRLRTGRAPLCFSRPLNAGRAMRPMNF